jgi:uncharacterized protein YyaL (SSP411 family)
MVMSMLVLALALAAASAANDRALYGNACERVAAAYDAGRGGFVARNGVPSEDAVELALIRSRTPGANEWKERALATVHWTRTLRDSVGGGYVLSAAETHARPARLHKPAVVNARRLENLISAWRLTQDPQYRAEAAQVADYFDRVLLDGRGGFIPGQGAGFDVVADANGVAIRAWLEWASATTDRLKRDFALKSLDRVWEACWVPEVGLIRRGSFSEVLGPPMLVDQVELGRALVLAARLGERPEDAARARTLGDLVLERFEDPVVGGVLTRWSPTKDGKVRRAPRVPSENARAARFLCELTALTGDLKYREGARRAWSGLDRAKDGMRLEAAGWALAIQAAIDPTLPEAPRWPAIAENATGMPWRTDITRSR